jgi:2-keto-3-deoxy-L-rhamnonate aldolase RhmA
MIERPEQIHELLKFARFAPEGARGIFSVSRAYRYGVPSDMIATQKKINEDLCLMAQIETGSGLERVEELAAIPGADLFIGPADLAASLGHPFHTSHPEVKAAAERIVRAGRANNKSIATACAPADYPFWIKLGIDLLFCSNDIACLRQAAGDNLNKARELLARTSAPSLRSLEVKP